MLFTNTAYTKDQDIHDQESFRKSGFLYSETPESNPTLCGHGCHVYGTAITKGKTPVAVCSLKLRAILRESEAKLEMKNYNPPSFFVWR